MTKNLTLLTAIFLCVSSSIFSQSDIIISQYIETNMGTTPKGIEIFNVSGADITFSPTNNLQIYKGGNGGACTALPGTNIISGTLLANEVWVLGTSDLTAYASSNGTNLSGTTTYGFSFNGDDALEVYLGGTIQDMFGICGSDPGIAWNGGGVSTRNNNLQVKDALCDGDTDGWTDPSVRFDQIANGSTMTGFGDAPAACSVSCPHTVGSFLPSSGPKDTLVTISGTGFTASSTVTFNGESASVTYVNSTTLIAEVPAGDTTGPITITEAGCPLDSSTNFTVITGDCTSGGTIPSSYTDLMFSGIYDETGGSCHYIELLNPTASDIDLSTYSIGSSNNQADGTSLPLTYNGGTYPLSGVIPAYGTLLILATSDTTNCASCTNVTLDLQFLNSSLGYNGFTVANYDKLILLNGAVPIDLWSNGDGHNNGYFYTRNSSATAPALLFNSADWDSSTAPDCFGFEIAVAPAPTIDTQPADIDNCDTASVNVSITASSGGSLSYLWKYNDGVSSTWADVTATAFSTGLVSGETTTDLSISGFNLDGYQFYCEVTEASVCTIATDAIQVTMTNSIWNGTTWSNGLPNVSTMAIIDGDYNTTAHGNFTACSLVINSGNTITVDDSSYIEIENSITVNGNLVVNSKGNLVQNQDSSFFNLNSGGTSIVNKMTTPLSTAWEYTYWSSPVTNTTVGSGLSSSNPSRRYWFNANNFLDVLDETDNTGAFTSGSDDIDDNGDDWQYAPGSTVMTPGVGYAAMHSTTGFVSGNSYQYVFSGAFNNGEIQTPIAYNGANGDNDWNLIGNPYASAIDSNVLFTTNAGIIDGSAYLWSHNTAASATASGSQNQNFTDADYAVITGGSGNTAGGDGVIPTDYIPSGQSFFVKGFSTTNLTFNNSMRMADATSNDQFFRTNNTPANRLWLNLTTDSDVFSQILVAYVDGATDDFDGGNFDASRSLAGGLQSAIYTLIPSQISKRFAVQGKATTSLNEDEIIPVGFKTTSNQATLYTFSIAQFEGDFMSNNKIYLKDNLLNTIHDLSTSNYTFTSEAGEFNTRFEVVFNNNSLSTEDFEIKQNELSIIELSNNNVEFSMSNGMQINSVKIFDVQGRLVYNLKAKNSTEVYNLSNISNAIYFAKVALENGQTLIKKAIKK